MEAIKFFDQIPDGCVVQQIVCTKFNSFLLTSQGTVYSWGETTNALGRPLEKKGDSRTPRILPDLKSQHIVYLAAGESHVLALTNEKTVWSWGFNKYGQLGHGNTSDSNLPVQIETLNKVVRIAAGDNFSFAVNEHGTVYAWGDNRNYQLGARVDEKGTKQVKFVTPRLIDNFPWSRSSEIEIAGRTGNMYVYTKGQTGDEEEGDGDFSKSPMQLRKALLDNDELKKSIENLHKKVAMLEEELFNEQAQNNPNFGHKIDSALSEMKEMLKRNADELSQYDQEMKAKDQEIASLSADTANIQGTVENLETKSANDWGEIEELDIKIRQLVAKSSQERGKIMELTNKRDNLYDFLQAIENSKAVSLRELHDKEEELENCIQEKKRLIEKFHDTEKKDILFKKMITARENDLRRLYYKEKKEDVEEDLIAIYSMHEALKETTIEAISSAVLRSSALEYIDISNNLMTRLEEEIKEMKHPSDNHIFHTINRIWAILEDNIKLRRQVNDYSWGLFVHTAQRLTEYQRSLETEQTSLFTNGLVTAKEYAKKILRKTIDKNPMVSFDEFAEPSKMDIKRKKPKNNWICF